MEIRNIISITLELFSLAISVFIIWFLLIQKRREKIDKIILELEALSALIVFFDALAHFYRGYPGQLGSVMVHLSNYLVFSSNYLMFIAYGVCIFTYIGIATKGTRISIRFVSFMSLLSILLVSINQYTGFIYYFDENNFYNRGPWYILSQLTPAIGGIIYIAVIIANRDKLKKNEFFTLAIFSMAPYVATFIQIFVYGYPFQVIITVVGCWGLFLSREVAVRNDLASSVEREKEKQEQLETALEDASKRNNILKSMAEIYFSMHLLDLENDTVQEYNSKAQVKEIVNHSTGAREMMKSVIKFSTDQDYQQAALEFTDLSTIADRMQNKKVVSEEFLGNRMGWYRAQFIAIETDLAKRPKRVVFTTQNIDEERRQREALIHESNTDELTGFFNRRAYERDVEKLKTVPIPENLVYVSFDVNRLKNINDTLGHAAGDELIIGATTCIREAFGGYGKLYRMGGDEFVCLLAVDEDKLCEIEETFRSAIASWHGKHVDSLTISYGIVLKKNHLEATVEEIAILADKAMYASKSEYYRQNGIDRRR